MASPIRYLLTCLLAAAGALILPPQAARADDPADCTPYRDEWRTIAQQSDADVMLKFWTRVPLRCALLRDEVNARLKTANAAPTPRDANPGRGINMSAYASLEVRGYVLSRENDFPPNAIAYAVPIFLTTDQAQRFCPAFIKRMTFEGALSSQTQLRVQYAGRAVEIVPFAWPVTMWNGEPAACTTLVARYDIGRARAFLNAARSQLQARPQAASLTNAAGPFIVIARRRGDSIVVYDLSQAPDADYDRWLLETMTSLESNGGATGIVSPDWRDKLRFAVFSAVPAVRNALTDLVPGFGRAEARP